MFVHARFDIAARLRTVDLGVKKNREAALQDAMSRGHEAHTGPFPACVHCLLIGYANSGTLDLRSSLPQPTSGPIAAVNSAFNTTQYMSCR